MPKRAVKATSEWSEVHLNAIRGVAALVVLLGHTRSLFFASFTSKAPSMHSLSSIRVGRATVGEEAVIVFFVLSGYLVGGSVLRSVRNGKWSWKEYLLKRLTRLWVVLLPALAFGITLDIIGMHLVGTISSIYGAPAATPVPHDLPARLHAGVITANALFLQGIVSPTAGTNDSLWSLAYEWWYYLMFPLAILIFASKVRPAIRILYVILLAAAVLFVGRGILALFPAWLLGAAIAAMPLSSIPKVVVMPIVSASMTVIMMIKRLDVSYYAAAECVALASAFILWCSVRHIGTCSNKSYQKASAFFSDISYTLYLTHLPLAVFICALTNRPWRYRTLSVENFSLFVIMNVGIIIIAFLFYGLFERNTDRVRRVLIRAFDRPRLNTSAAPVLETPQQTDISGVTVCD